MQRYGYKILYLHTKTKILLFNQLKCYNEKAIKRDIGEFFMKIQMDALTGMPQQRGYLDLVDDCLEQHPGESFCMLTTDIEHFSYYNKWYFMKPERVAKYFQKNDAPLRMKIRCRHHDKWICTVAEMYRSVEYSSIKPVILVTLLDCRTDSDIADILESHANDGQNF